MLVIIEAAVFRTARRAVRAAEDAVVVNLGAAESRLGMLESMQVSAENRLKEEGGQQRNERGSASLLVSFLGF